MFEHSFRETIAFYTKDEILIDSFWKEIASAYSNSSRKYHTLVHLENLNKELLPLKEKIGDWEIIVFSIAYHDIVYNTLKGDNEEESAKLAVARLNQLEIQKERIELCNSHILATKRHVANDTIDTSFFTDADLSILGYELPVYREYAQQIRKEYRYYPGPVYKAGRKKVLNHFLNMDRIFQTNHFYNLYERQARKNLTNELESLN